MDTDTRNMTATAPTATHPAPENNGSHEGAKQNAGKPRVRRTLQERKDYYEKRKEALKKTGARLKKATRKERDGQLIVWGIFIETYYKCCGVHERNELREALKEHLKDRELDRALAGCDRLDQESPAKAEDKEKIEETPQGFGAGIRNIVSKILE